MNPEETITFFNFNPSLFYIQAFCKLCYWWVELNWQKAWFITTWATLMKELKNQGVRPVMRYNPTCRIVPATRKKHFNKKNCSFRRPWLDFKDIQPLLFVEVWCRIACSLLHSVHWEGRSQKVLKKAPKKPNKNCLIWYTVCGNTQTRAAGFFCCFFLLWSAAAISGIKQHK